MELLVDLFGYLSIIVHGLTILSQSMALGGALFLVFLTRPLDLPAIGDTAGRIAGWSAVALLASEAATVGLQAAVLMDTVGLDFLDVMGGGFAIAGTIKIVAAALLALILLTRRAPSALLVALIAVELLAATLTTHAAARLDDRAVLLVVEGLHQLGAAIWIGGLPCFAIALARLHDPVLFRLVGARYSRMSMVGAASILVSGVTMSL